MAEPELSLFEGFGVEIEYMIVDDDSLDVRPYCDRVLAAAAGDVTNEVQRGAVAWSNELTAHLIEIKTNGPAPALAPLTDAFATTIGDIEGLLERDGARLLPGAMHPWMDPEREMLLWPHDYSPIYQAYDRIFDCRGHGWANLQSVHLNLPFANDDELHRLHAGIRHLLCLLPALAASSPVADGRDSGFADYRLEVYRHNSRRIPEVTGLVVPEVVDSAASYRERILLPMYRAIAPLDPQHLLQEEWLNSRGAIARFDRFAIEIRVLDTQECPRADLAILGLVVAVLQALLEERFGHLKDLDTLETGRLKAILEQCVVHGDEARIEDSPWLSTFGLRGKVWARDLWGHLLERCGDLFVATGVDRAPLELILDQGTLSRRLRQALELPAPGRRIDAFTLVPTPPAQLPRSAMTDVYRRLADCLRQGSLFHE